MKRISMLIAGFIIVYGINIKADDATEAKEPKELIQARITYQNSVKSLVDPVKKKYIAQLEDMKKMLGGKGDINGAMAVGNEIKALINADTTTEHSLKITKATYGSKRNSVNVTKNLTTQIKNNEIEVRVDTMLSDGKDPEFGTIKILNITYTYDGVKKEASFKDGEIAKIPAEDVKVK